MTTFHPFPRLPWELRARIWELTVEPRTVEVDIRYNHPITHDMATRYFLSLGAYTRNPEWILVLHLRSSTPVPAPLQTCREARIHLTEDAVGLGRPFYRKAFEQLPEAKANEWSDIPLPAKLRLELGLALKEEEGDPQQRLRRYVWVNFDLDMLSIGRSNFYWLEPHYNDIKRLKFARRYDDVYIAALENIWWITNRNQLEYLLKFVNLREVHVVCLDGLKYWREAGELNGFFPAGLSEEDVLLTDAKTGKMRTYAEIKKKRRRMG